MIYGIDASAERFLMDLEEIRARSARAQNEVSSGLRVTKPSDDPEHIQHLLLLRAHQGQTVQIRMNLGRAKAEVEAAEQGLQTAMKAMDRAMVTGMEATSPGTAASTRESLAAEALTILEQLVSIAGIRADGRYVFGGETTQAPYTVDLSQPDGVSDYAGMAGRDITHPAGTRFTISRTAQEIFDDAAPENNVFGAINELRIALENVPAAVEGDPDYNTQFSAQTDQIAAALERIRSAREHLGGQLNYYGIIQNRIDEAITYANEQELRDVTVRSEIEDADVTAAILALSQSLTQEQAALGVRAKLPRSSLFDFLG